MEIIKQCDGLTKMTYVWQKLTKQKGIKKKNK